MFCVLPSIVVAAIYKYLLNLLKFCKVKMSKCLISDDNILLGSKQTLKLTLSLCLKLDKSFSIHFCAVFVCNNTS